MYLKPEGMIRQSRILNRIIEALNSNSLASVKTTIFIREFYTNLHEPIITPDKFDQVEPISPRYLVTTDWLFIGGTTTWINENASLLWYSLAIF